MTHDPDGRTKDAEVGVTAPLLPTRRSRFEPQGEPARAGHAGVEDETLAEFLPDPYVVSDVHGAIRSANHAAAEMFGSSRDALIGRPLAVFVPLEGRAQFRSGLAALLRSGDREQWRTTMRGPDGDVPVRLTVAVRRGEDRRGSRRSVADEATPGDERQRLLAAALQSAIVAQVIVDRDNVLVFANDRAQSLFRLAPSDLGRPLQDLELSHRPLDLRSPLEQAYAERRSITRSEVEWRSDGDVRWFDVCVAPLETSGAEPGGASITFADATLAKRLQMQLIQSNMELETAYEELQSTNEELQATNEELHAMNDELRRRGDELDEVNGLLESIFTSVRAGVVVVDRDLSVLVWNAGAEETWGLRGPEVEGKPLLNLDIGLPVEQLKQPLRAAVNGDAPTFERVLPATNRRGRSILCRIVGNSLVSPGDGGAPRGAILIMTTEDGPAGSDGAARGKTAADAEV